MSSIPQSLTNNSVSFDLIQIPKRSLPSTQITMYSAHACKSFATIDHEEQLLYQKPIVSLNAKQQEQSRTQHKIMLQRQCFLADDKNHLEHPENMRRLTKELDRMNREYRYVKQYHDPFVLSLNRVKALQNQGPPRLQRRASSHTIQEYIKNFQEQRRHSFSSVMTTSKPASSSNFISRVFSSSPLSSSGYKHYQNLPWHQMEQVFWYARCPQKFQCTFLHVFGWNKIYLKKNVNLQK